MVGHISIIQLPLPTTTAVVPYETAFDALVAIVSKMYRDKENRYREPSGLDAENYIQRIHEWVKALYTEQKDFEQCKTYLDTKLYEQQVSVQMKLFWIGRPESPELVVSAGIYDTDDSDSESEYETLADVAYESSGYTSSDEDIEIDREE